MPDRTQFGFASSDFLKPLSNVNAQRHETRNRLHRRLLADGHFEKNRRGRSPGHRLRRRSRSPENHRPDTRCGTVRRAARRRRGGHRRSRLRGTCGPDGRKEAGNAPRLGNARRGDRRLRQPGLRKGRRGAGRAGRPAGIRPRGRRGIRRRTLVQHPPKPPSPRDVPTRRISPGPRSSAPRCAKSSRRERRPRSTPRN